MKPPLFASPKPDHNSTRNLTRGAVRCALITALAAPLSAFALAGGSVVSDPAASPWSGVGSLSVNGSLFTATLIAPGYVLTAAHVVGADPSAISFQTNASSSAAIVASAVFVNPGYTGSTSGYAAGDPTKHADLAIIKLSSDVQADIPVYQLFNGNLQSQMLTFASYARSATQLQTGKNVADVVFADSSGTKQTYMFDYDGTDSSSNFFGGPTLGANVEASLVDGDSGSAAFVYFNGQWQLAGINTFKVTFTAADGSVGNGGGGVVLASYSDWVDSIVLMPVPEPSEWLMLLAGLGLVSSVSNRRSSCHSAA